MIKDDPKTIQDDKRRFKYEKSWPGQAPGFLSQYPGGGEGFRPNALVRDVCASA